jgi:hypothetical protein
VSRPAVPATTMATFVVRFRREPSAGQVRWRGQIEHVQSGQSAAFLDLEAMLRFLRRFGMEMGETCRRASDTETGA